MNLFLHRPISDLDLPDLPDFLKPKPSTPRPIRPIQDIDLPDGASVIQPNEDALNEKPPMVGDLTEEGIEGAPKKLHFHILKAECHHFSPFFCTLKSQTYCMMLL